MSRSSKIQCHICERFISVDIEVDGLCFCPDHAKLYQTGKWLALIKGNASPTYPEFGVDIYELKQALVAREVPCFIKTFYFENEGEIVTGMELFVLKEDLDRAKSLSRGIKPQLF